MAATSAAVQSCQKSASGASGRRARLLELLATNDEFGLDRYQNHRRLVRALRDRDPAAAEKITVERARAGFSDLLEAGMETGAQ